MKRDGRLPAEMFSRPLFRSALCVLALSTRVVSADPWPRLVIPAENAAALRQPPARPPAGDARDRADHLVQALTTGDSDAALDFFLPREPFLAVKDMSDAGGYYATLVRAYRRDITAWRAELPRGVPVALVRFEPAGHCAWMTVGREANRLPYWSCYGARVVVRAGTVEHTFRVAVMINWGTQWYVTHLGPIARRAAAQ